MDDDDGLACCCGCCLLCCTCATSVICNWFTFLLALAAAAVLIAAFGVALPVRATVTDASLSRLDVVAATTTSNVTTSAAAAPSSSVSIAYNLSLTVQLHNRNWAMRVELAAPLDAELRFAGRRFDGARLADAGRSVPPRRTEEFRVLAASPPSSPGAAGGAAVPLGGGAGAAAELARERAEGVFEVELRIAGEVRYRPVHAGRNSRLVATCPLKLLMPNAPRGTHLVVLQKDVSCY